MKFAILLVLVVAFAVFYESDAAWGRRVWRRVKPRVIRWAVRWAIRRVGKRENIPDITELDKNLDGLLDQAELERIMSTRDAQEVLENHDGDSTITTSEFEEILRNLRETESE